jgi:polyhydroxyalkanoate synthesis regulator protein
LVPKITLSKDTDPLGRLIRENIEMASNQMKHNVEMGTAMTNSFIKMSGTLSKETTVANENARKEMMASAEKMKDSFRPDRRSKTR